MKKMMIFVVILSFVFVGSLSAQGLGFGVKGGLNMAKFTGDDMEIGFEELGQADPGFVFGPTLGGFVIYNFNDKLAAQVEVLYTAKGSSYDLDFSFSESGVQLSVDGTVDMKMKWLDIPILVVYNVFNDVKVFAGPFVEFYLNGTAKSDFTVTGSYEGETYSESESDSDDIESEDVNSPGFGLIFGGTFMVTDNLGVEGRYALGLTSMDEDLTIKNSGIQVLVSYYLKK